MIEHRHRLNINRNLTFPPDQAFLVKASTLPLHSTRLTMLEVFTSSAISIEEIPLVELRILVQVYSF